MNTHPVITAEERQRNTELLNLAKSELPNLVEGELFFLSDLFYGYQWKRIPKQDRSLLGRTFLDYAQTGEGARKIVVMGKSARSQQSYARK
ncbi:MAG: single-stranded DNA-binding protein [Oscillospiraceae bacterium]|nr:single-stranded DNA-binding protein [Oscillospiraceae bacterium]